MIKSLRGLGEESLLNGLKLQYYQNSYQNIERVCDIYIIPEEIFDPHNKNNGDYIMTAYKLKENIEILESSKNLYHIYILIKCQIVILINF